MIRQLVRVGAVVATCVAVVTAGTTTASAGNGKTGSGSTAGGDGSEYTVHVNYTHRGEGSNPQSVKYSAPFTPPVCWYTAMTPDQFKAEIARRYDNAGQKGAGTVYEYYNQVMSDMNTVDYHKGDDGSWWVLTWDDTRLNDPGSPWCAYAQGWLWEPPGNPPQNRITPDMLAQAAYGQMKLPSEGVTLSPPPLNQKVNLPTYVNFTQADAQVSVTAQLTEPDGTVIAATVVAEPYRLHVEAGTPDADPRTCDYTVDGGKLDTAGASCNITYLKASDGGTYPFTADTTWRVWWSPTADVQPMTGNPTLPSGLTETRQDVTVKEIQAVNR
ncbi:MAG: hypothetical protein HOY76_20690 [Streptomyces sp.]|nr:hypothetical protein [Streptomyces sp.]